VHYWNCFVLCCSYKDGFVQSLQEILAEQQCKFSNWQVLRAFDLSPVSGLNYNGIETLRKVEELEKYERGILPS
jgi:hypothetical protein